MATSPTGGIVGEGAVLSGKMRGQDLTVLGVVEGEVHLEGRLQVGAGGRVIARVRATDVVVDGEIEGDVLAASLTLGETARARGTFRAKRLVVKEGAVVEGAINPGAADREATVVGPPVPPVPPVPSAPSVPSAPEAAGLGERGDGALKIGGVEPGPSGPVE